MTLESGTRLGPYEIVAPIGAGGMGEVYRARDTRLERTVAVKILPSHLSADAEARQRFEREARAISSLNHPNICTLYDVGHQEGVDYLVMEFLEGETLAARLGRGALPLDQFLKYAMDICEGLDRAHRGGVVHRDLKPGNVMLSKSGAKLMDFGLAKQKSAAQAGHSSLEATLTTPAGSHPLTAQGTVVGTFQYMSPEQVEGKEADARSDMFALGAVLYEMATGKRAFEGKTAASAMAAVLEREPAPISSVQPMTPPAMDRLVKTCLAKDPDDRWQTAHDVKLQLKHIAEGGSQTSAAAMLAPRRTRGWGWAGWAVAALLAVVAGAAWLGRREATSTRSSLQTFLPAPQGTTYFFNGDAAGFPVISPQGDKVAFVAVDEHGGRLLWVRSLVDGSVRSLPGTESPFLPFWSPDGKSLGFFSAGQMKRISLSGGAAVDIAPADNPRGGAWGVGDVILYTPATQSGMFSVPATGGTPKEITPLDARHTTYRWPYFLPDGKHFLYLAGSHTKPHAELDEIYVASVDGKDARRLTGTTSNAIAVPGYLLFLQGTALVAQPFDESSAKLSGEPTPVALNVHFEEGNWRGVFDASADGTLIYQALTGAQGSELIWYGRDGRVLSKLGEMDRYQELRLSPDGKSLAVAVGDPSSNVWVYDLERGLRTRFTFTGTSNRNPIWSPDGKQIAFSRGQTDLFVIGAHSAGTEGMLISSPSLKRPTDWSPDGKTMLLSEAPLGVGVSTMNVESKEVKEFLPRELSTTDAQFSPDGHWVAYTSLESGHVEVFVTQIPGPNGKWQISTNGGQEPRWRGDGKAIFYWSIDHTFMEAEVEPGAGQFSVRKVQPLFKAEMPMYPFGSPMYDVTRDGKRFIVNTASSVQDQPITVVTNWSERVKK